MYNKYSRLTEIHRQQRGMGTGRDPAAHRGVADMAGCAAPFLPIPTRWAAAPSSPSRPDAPPSYLACRFAVRAAPPLRATAEVKKYLKYSTISC
jgi:hypothetical protein